ncbi:tonB-system energizer ExbB [Rhizobium sp. RU36D]|uniref:tonB-system energizer ExbB n=1 Tax=Rhizobium sp. RU36D TaxID=1907415 RepID=UPI0009D87117|nr:tonB-system energizer ExbB [Rhizobium sp. RU36D]SMD01699.1 outer membrane transport energization protein ExbB [Rhizobium sp. RU36D]
MLQRHSGPSILAVALATFVYASADVSAQQGETVAPTQQVSPGSLPAPTTDRVVTPANADGAAVAPPAEPQAMPAPPQASQPAASSALPAVPQTSASPAAPADPAPGVAASSDAGAQAAPGATQAQAPASPAVTLPEGQPGQPVQLAPPSQQSLTPAETQLQPIADEPSGMEALIESYVPGLLPERNENLPHDLSPIGMFLAADWVVKGVMLSLIFASLVTWTVWIAKTLQLTGAKARAAKGIKAVTTARSLAGALEVLGQRGGTVASMVRVAAHEVRLSDAAIDHAGGEGVKERVGSALNRIEVRAGRGMSKGTGVLATIGSTAPFVGLFGTVWGIMNSFIGISESQTTNLAVVAPGIAEALLATAIGLVAAIPAVIIYNVFARSVTAYRQSLADAAAGIERLVSRDLDFRKIPVEARNNPKIKLVTE